MSALAESPSFTHVTRVIPQTPEPRWVIYNVGDARPSMLPHRQVLAAFDLLGVTGILEEVPPDSVTQECVQWCLDAEDAARIRRQLARSKDRDVIFTIAHTAKSGKVRAAAQTATALRAACANVFSFRKDRDIPEDGITMRHVVIRKEYQ
jgi:hypothetical protein